ncbi:uncharacterized protein MONBRDRAFT_38531 [Monosiga brevicollis MX1]|uniref:Nucleolar GTP-binding protein 1 n=1 Tax=Monosiga brevicollis TaxID=81824 RepID=A9V8I7_MONBE|nr:uncharacterized protein MONBRDRAFT_38531 [Monosiga brevicollis MX1]EDQ86152.1 predicted protein [Monosiga brevicollis MX1]|eukprot:XP_001749077.1 hypothetical protein [Monosiga brevicollis MX1]
MAAAAGAGSAGTTTGSGGKQYNFKSITIVPTAKDFIDIVLSRTQRKTPTVIHKNYKITRIRAFYTRKVKYTQQTFHDKLSTIITEFPKLDDVHPFYADLMNVLYDKDHYKLALGHINNACHLIDNVAKDYVRLLKYGDSLYRCKQLKRAAMGRMCTIMKRQASSLAYLEQVRQHLSRLPSINPTTRTLLVTGFPNVGKSSFVNKITRADVEVQPYAFTTKSLFVGHTDYKHLRWQVIDTPGILDQPLEQRNTIEMQAITALAHLRACVLYFMDLSEQCGHTFAEQISLFENIKPLFANKPLILVINKIDTVALEDLDADKRAVVAGFEESGITVLTMSTLTEEGVANVRNTSCDLLLAHRVDAASRTHRAESILNRLHVAMPARRDDKERPAFVPDGAEAKRMGRVPTKGRQQRIDAEEARNNAMDSDRKLLRDVQDELGPEYSTDMRAEWDLKDNSWRYDAIPEIVDGKNVADFIDPDIMAKLEELEMEEEARERAGEYDSESEDEADKVARAQSAMIRHKRMIIRQAAHLRKSRNAPVLPKAIRQKLKQLPKDMKRERREYLSDNEDGDAMDTSRDGDRDDRRGSGRRERSPIRRPEASFTARKQMDRQVDQAAGMAGLLTAAQKRKAVQKRNLGMRNINYQGRQGEADRRILTRMPKHLFAGKRGNGTADRR